MKTAKTQLSNDSKMKILFEFMFRLQIELENHTGEDYNSRREVNEVIESIDRLMEAMIKVS